MAMTYLGIIRCKMIETLLNDMISVKVLDQIHNSIFQSMNDGLDLYESARISSAGNSLLTCSRVEMNWIIFCKARVPCWLSAI